GGGGGERGGGAGPAARQGGGAAAGPAGAAPRAAPGAAAGPGGGRGVGGGPRRRPATGAAEAQRQQHEERGQHLPAPRPHRPWAYEWLTDRCRRPGAATLRGSTNRSREQSWSRLRAGRRCLRPGAILLLPPLAGLRQPVRRQVDAMPLGVRGVHLDGPAVADAVVVGRAELLEALAPRLDLLHRHLDAKVPGVPRVLLHPVRVEQRQIELAVGELGDPLHGVLVHGHHVERLLIPLGELPRILTGNRDVAKLRCHVPASCLFTVEHVAPERWPCRCYQTYGMIRYRTRAIYAS